MTVAIGACDNKEELIAMVGTVIDSWAISHGLTSEEAQQMLVDLCEFQKDVHEAVRW